MSSVTVIIPVLNGMPFLGEMLQSLENQTCPDFEVFLWDNGSTDGTVEEAKKWIPARLSGKVVSDQPLPLHECLAAMVAQSETEFCARMDADDVCLPERFEKQLAHLKSHPDLAMVGGQMELIDEHGKSQGPAGRSPLRFADILFAFLFNNPMAHPALMFRREAVIKVGNYARPKPVEDLDLWLRLAAVAPLGNLPDTVLRYRRHSAAVCGTLGAANPELLREMVAATGEHITGLLGLPKDQFASLRGRTFPVSLIPLWQVARRISQRTGVSVRSILSRKENVFIVRCLTRDGDWLSKIAWRLFERFS